MLPRPFVRLADDSCDFCSLLPNMEVAAADVAVIEEAVAGCVAGNGCNMLRLVVDIADGSSTCPGMLALAVDVVVAVGGAGSGSKLIVVVVGGTTTALMRPAGMAYTGLEPVNVMPSGPRTVAVAE